MNRTEIEDRPLKHTLYKMLKNALIEIRASQDIQKSRAIADIFHNLPLMLVQCRSAEDDQRAYELLQRKAEKYNLENYIVQLKSCSS